MIKALGPDVVDDVDSDVAIGSRLALVRVGLGMTQASFAESLGVSPRSYFHYEKGTRGLSTEILRRLRVAHGLNLMWVLYGEGLPRDGEDAEALAQFVKDLSALLSASEAVLPPEGLGKIVSRWWNALKGGTRIDMKDVRFWIDLLKQGN